jgi:hypothetical protein
MDIWVTQRRQARRSSNVSGYAAEEAPEVSALIIFTGLSWLRVI